MSKIQKLRDLLIEYSPIALIIVVLPYIFSISNELQRSLLLLFCTLPAGILCLLCPKKILTNPILWLAGLFIVYFSVQHICNMPQSRSLYISSARLALMMLGPVVLLSFASPSKKLYQYIIGLTVIALAIKAGYMLVTFYSNYSFPLTRFATLFGEITQPVTTAQFFGFAAVLGSAFFIQKNSQNMICDLLLLICISILTIATLYSHSRSIFLALIMGFSSLVLTLRKRPKKTLILYSVLAITICVYLLTIILAPQISKKWKDIHSTEITMTKLSSTNASKLPITEQKTHHATRERGLLATSKGDTACITARYYIWKDHISRMGTAKNWLIGHGLGMSVFTKESLDPKASRWYTMTKYGWEPHTHSMFVWALYYGGIIGLGLLLALLSTTTFRALRAGLSGQIVFALIVYSVFTLMFNGSKLLIAHGISVLSFWMPIALASALPSFKQSNPN